MASRPNSAAPSRPGTAGASERGDKEVNVQVLVRCRPQQRDTPAGRSIVQLNVGGHYYSTTLDTLMRDGSSMLAAMFSGRYKDFGVASEGQEPVFIDRDGTRFRHVLNYLRNGRLHLPEDPILYGELLEEAEYFGLEGMRAMLEEQLEEAYERQEEARRLEEEARAQSVMWDHREVALLKGMLGQVIFGGAGQNVSESLPFTTDADF